MSGTPFDKIRRHLVRLLRGADRFGRRFTRPIGLVKGGLSVVTFIAASLLMVCFVIYAGFEHTDDDRKLLMILVRIAQGCFLINVAFSVLFNHGHTFGSGRLLNTIVNATVLVTLLPWLYPRPEHPWIPWLETLLYSNYFLFSVLTLYSVIDISSSVMLMLGKRTNPSLILSGSFIVFILIGSLLLMLPRCSYYGMRYIDALYLSTSAICITGLTTIDIPATLTPMGLSVLALLIQVGALGVMIFTSFFSIFFTGSSSIYSQLLLRDVIYSKSMSTLIPTLLYVLGFTLAIEAAGACAILLSIHGTLGMTTEEEIIFSAFHALSGFCNAGFSNIPGGLSNPALMSVNLSFYWIMSLLIAAGAIGFPIMVNFKDVIFTCFRRAWRKLRMRDPGVKEVHIYSMNTKIVLVTFLLLFIAGAVGFWLLERHNTLEGMSCAEQITQSVFNSVTPRSAGFSSVDPARFLSPTLVMVMLLMWIGGGSQSTAGGIKVNTLAAICLNLRAIVTGGERVTAFRRTVALSSVRRANAVVAISILSFSAFAITVMVLEPHLPARDILFETLSALFTVGSSLGITAELSTPSKLVMCCAMFLGRVGIISLMSGIAGRRHQANVSYPSDNIIIS